MRRRARRLDHFVPRHRQDVADEHVLEVLALGRGLAHRQDGGRRRDRVADADDRFLRDARALTRIIEKIAAPMNVNARLTQ